MQYVFLYEDNSPSSDHCGECGGEAYEGSTGRLYRVHLVSLNNDSTVHYAHDTDICQGCMDGIKSLYPRPFKYGVNYFTPKNPTDVVAETLMPGIIKNEY